MRALIHYLAAVILLTIYGAEVCPRLESLSFFTLGGILLCIFSIIFLGRIIFLKSILEKIDPFSRARFQFFIEFGSFVTAGLGLAFFNMSYFDFPLSSGLKLTAGCLALGIFTAADLALERERIVAFTYKDKIDAQFSVDKIFPLTRKFAFFGSILAIFSGIIVSLIILRDLNVINNLASLSNLNQMTQSILFEIFFIIIVLLIYCISILLSYSRNLKIFFGRQTKVLEEVSNGHYSNYVPITTSDEFAIIAQYTNNMIVSLKERTIELQNTKDVTIRALASLAETRDNETGQHIIRTQNYVRALAVDLKNHEKFKEKLDEKTIELLFKSAPLHDVGKVGIQDSILLKPGRLTDEEFEEMKRHPIYGYEALRVAETQLGSNSFLHMAGEIAYTHHEKWNGSGYPRGLKGEEIPLSGRLMALADVYDALISKRVYKPAFSHEKACSIIREGKETHFDPDIVDAFDRCEEEFKKIAREHADLG